MWVWLGLVNTPNGRFLKLVNRAGSAYQEFEHAGLPRKRNGWDLARPRSSAYTFLTSSPASRVGSLRVAMQV